MADETRTDTGESSGARRTLELGPSITSPPALARALTDHWVDGTRAFLNGEVERFIREGLGDTALADFAREQAQGNASSADARMFRLILRLDPKIEPQYMGYEVNEAGLSGLAAEQDGPFPTQDSSGALRTMYTDRVLTVYAEASGASRFRELDERWHEEFTRWQEHVERVSTEGAEDLFAAQAWRARARILLSLLDTKAAEAARDRAKDAALRAPGHSWMKGLSAEDPSVGTVQATADIGHVAATTEDPVVTNRKARARARRGRLVAGAVGLVIVGLIAWAVVAVGGGSDQAAEATPSAGVSATTGPSQQDPSTATVSATGLTKTAVDLLEAPEEGANVVQQLDQGTVIEFIGSSGTFQWIRLKDDPTVGGYVPKSDVSTVCSGRCNVAPPEPTGSAAG